MKAVKKNLHQLLFFLFIGIMLLPLSNNLFKGKEIKALKGYYEKQEAPTFSMDNWFAGTFQDTLDKHINDNFGYRSLFVRTFNQINFSLFDKISVQNVIIGKDNYLYEENYINSYFGLDFIGQDSIQEKVIKLKQIQDTLKKLGTDLIVVLAPGKGSYFPEYFPEEYTSLEVGATNYKYYLKHLQEQQLPLINFKAWFLAKKDSSEHALFPKTGVHWSKYAELKVADSLIQFIADMKGITHPPRINITAITKSSEAWDTDDDIEQSMNLLLDIPDLMMSYPYYTYDIPDSSARPKVITVADSYYWGLYNLGLSHKAFNNSPFWYYNQKAFSGNYEQAIDISELQIQKEVESSDVIILLSTDANLYSFAFGWIEHMYAIYYP